MHDIYLEMTTERRPFSLVSPPQERRGEEEEAFFSGLQGGESF